MAVTLSAVTLRDAMHLGATDAETADATRLLATCTALVEKWAPDAPDAVQDEAVVRLASFLFDLGGGTGLEQRGSQYSRPMLSSGAAHLLGPWRRHTGSVAKVAI